MNLEATFKRIDGVDVEMRITMTLGEWRAFREQIRELRHPAFALGHQIATVVARLEQRAGLNEHGDN